MQYGYKPTTHGRALTTKCAALEKPLELTRVAVGSGQVPEGTNLADVHELYQYVADGTIGERTHKDNRLYFTVQYNTIAHPEVPTFHLNEFIVFAMDPETGEDVDLLYATLGDYGQPVPAYSPSLPPSVWNFPVVLAVSDEIEVSIPAAPGIVTHDDLQRLLNEGVIGVSRTEITIPAEGWKDAEEDGVVEFSSYPLYIDIPVTGAKSRMTPMVTIFPEYLDSAKNICQTAKTIEGALRIFAKSAPAGDIKASLTLIGGSGYIGTLPGGGDIPIATEATIGGVIVGSGLSVDSEGKLSVDTDTVMTNEDLVDEEAVQKDVADILDGEDEA